MTAEPANIYRPRFGFRPRPVPPVSNWEAGPDPEALRSQARDLTAVQMQLSVAFAEADCELAWVIELREPELRGLHIDRLSEVLDRIDSITTNARRIARGNEPEAA